MVRQTQHHCPRRPFPPLSHSLDGFPVCHHQLELFLFLFRFL